MSIYTCAPTSDGTGSASEHLSAWFQAWASSKGITLEPGTLNLCADRDVVPPPDFISLRSFDAVLLLGWRKIQAGYDPRLYPILLRGSQRAWLFRWADVENLRDFVGDTAQCAYLRRCEVIGEINFTKEWTLTSGTKVSLAFADAAA